MKDHLIVLPRHRLCRGKILGRTRTVVKNPDLIFMPTFPESLSLPLFQLFLNSVKAHPPCHAAFPVNMLDPIRKCFGYSQLWSLWLACSLKRARLCMPDPTSRIHFSSIFPEKAYIKLSYCAKPTWIWSGWPGQALTKRILCGSKPVHRNHRARFLAGCNQPATSFPLSDLIPFFHRRPR